jgi:hypothetical protein
MQSYQNHPFPLNPPVIDNKGKGFGKDDEPYKKPNKRPFCQVIYTELPAAQGWISRDTVELCRKANDVVIAATLGSENSRTTAIGGGMFSGVSNNHTLRIPPGIEQFAIEAMALYS